jgi:two-component system, OmpR family, response regulator
VRVLVVEDEPKLARLITTGLREEGWAADQTASGAEALWFASEHEYDAILLDLSLVDGDGTDVCRALRAQGCWSPIVVVTARDGLSDRVTLLDLGADDYVTKPFAFAELLARLRAVSRRGRAPRPSDLVAGSLRLEPATRRVTRDGTELALTAKEFALLEYLLRHPDRVLTRAELVEHVWDFAFAGDPRNVDVYVRYLRRKIDEPFGTDTIETVRGAGYRLRAAP